MSHLTFRFSLAATLLGILIVNGSAVPAHAESVGGPGGTWPKTWPQELEPYRKTAWTWEGGKLLDVSYHLAFKTQKEFEAAWPHLLKVKDAGTSITLLTGPQVMVWERNTPRKSSPKSQTAGVIISMPTRWAKEGPYTKVRIALVVDGTIVDLNRIKLPADTLIDDRRFQAN